MWRRLSVAFENPIDALRLEAHAAQLRLTVRDVREFALYPAFKKRPSEFQPAARTRHRRSPPHRTASPRLGPIAQARISPPRGGYVPACAESTASCGFPARPVPGLDLDKYQRLSIHRHEIDFGSGRAKIARDDPVADALQMARGDALSARAKADAVRRRLGCARDPRRASASRLTAQTRAPLSFIYTSPPDHETTDHPLPDQGEGRGEGSTTNDLDGKPALPQTTADWRRRDMLASARWAAAEEDHYRTGPSRRRTGAAATDAG